MKSSHHAHDLASQLGIGGLMAGGTALALTGIIAVSPVAPALGGAVPPSVQLTASLDLFGPWADVFNTTLANATDVFDAIKEADFGFPGSLQEALAAITFIGVDVATPEGSDLAAQTLDWSHLWGLQYLAGMDMGMGVVPVDAAEPAATILTLLSSPLSGVLMGLIGPLVSPGVELINSIGSIVDSIGDGDFEAALQGLLAAPANVVGAFFNGATLNLDALVPLLNDALQVPEGNAVLGASFDFGGLFTPGVTDSGSIGGSIYNSLGLDLQMVGMGMPYSAPGEGIGLIASLVNLLDMFVAGTD
ncbi:outer membrane porin GjpA [Mycolicibacter heraklionensis]|uniref:Outer membrane porin GjpA n=1 Tax=Mycolicibacter heraklionensis TaxID=512402 RepID=A0A9X7WGI1_9MYCO|nr:outer membrane porin GjpA [Mycolicibacter heraklionensis]QZA07442.1 outer membrane porin GjpA [Mycolicibacter heraklionensis]